MCKLNLSLADKIGLSDSQYAELYSVFSGFPCVVEVIVYGSRAKGNYSDRSDLDLVVTLHSSDKSARHTIAQIKLALDDSNLVPSVDIQELENIKNARLKDHISRRGIKLTL